MDATSDIWGFLHDLVFGSPRPLLLIIDVTTGLLVVGALCGLVVRCWNGDRIELGPLKIDRPELVRNLETSVDAIAKDDRLKKNVLWTFRERLHEATAVIVGGTDGPRVRTWSRGVLTDIITMLSEGGDDRHRASIWINVGDRLCMYNGVGFRRDALDNASLPIDSIAGTILRTGKSHNSRDVDDDNAFAPKPRSGRPYKSLLAVPIRTPIGKTIAALCIDAEAPAYFDADHEFFAGCFAELIALLLTVIVAGDEFEREGQLPKQLSTGRSENRSRLG